MVTKFREGLRYLAGIIAGAVFLVSLGFEAFCTTNGCRSSVDVLLVGWFGLLSGGAGICWLANPMIIIGLILTFKGSKYSVIFSALATALCFSFLLFDQVIEDEAGHYREIISYQAGYWLWCSSAVLLFINNIVFRKAAVLTNNAE